MSEFRKLPNTILTWLRIIGSATVYIWLPFALLRFMVLCDANIKNILDIGTKFQDVL